MDHWDDTADNPRRDKRVGSTGTDGVFAEPYLGNSLHIQDARAVKLINGGRFKRISRSYLCDPVFKPGDVQGSTTWR